MSNPKRIADIFPANVHITAQNSYPDVNPQEVNWKRESYLPGSTFCDIARVIAHGNTLSIGVDSSTGPVLFFREQFTERTRDENKITRFITVSGRIIVVNKDLGCGCGSRLKNWSPVGNIASSG